MIVGGMPIADTIAGAGTGTGFVGSGKIIVARVTGAWSSGGAGVIYGRSEVGGERIANKINCCHERQRW